MKTSRAVSKPTVKTAPTDQTRAGEPAAGPLAVMLAHRVATRAAAPGTATAPAAPRAGRRRARATSTAPGPCRAGRPKKAKRPGDGASAAGLLTMATLDGDLGYAAPSHDACHARAAGWRRLHPLLL